MKTIEPHHEGCENTTQTQTTQRMFKQILDALTTKYKGVDARILTRMARKLAKSVKSEDEVQDAVDGVTMMDFIQQESDRSAQAATKNAVNDYEQKYHIKDGKPFKAAEPTPPCRRRR